MQSMQNPFRPGAGHLPPYLAGREEEKEEFQALLDQDIVSNNLLITGLRGIGKTVLLETLKPIAISKKWMWTGTDLSESASVSEQTLAIRIIADLSLLVAGLTISDFKQKQIGFLAQEARVELGFEKLIEIYSSTPGLVADKLKAIFEIAWMALSTSTNPPRGVVFAYDEAQTLSDHQKESQFPLSVLLDVFQSTQRKEIPFLLILTGLPTLQTKLVESRTYSERLFRVLILDKLNALESKAAIEKPIVSHPLKFNEASIALITHESGGYPYFIQFIGKEAYDVWVRQVEAGNEPTVPMSSIIQKLDNDFFSARWSKATPRQRELMITAAMLNQEEFTPKEIAIKSRGFLNNPFSDATSGQTLAALIESGLIYKNRRGSYSFAVPLLARYIQRKEKDFIQQCSLPGIL